MLKFAQATLCRRAALTPVAKIVVVLSALGIAGCKAPMQAMAPMPEMMMASAMPVMPAMPAAPQPTPGLDPRARFQLAINLLQQGDSTHADVELKAYLMAVPNSAAARNMLTQIETPIAMLYPPESFTVQVGPSDSLSSIAGIYLGDVLAFYGLARYNGIDVPSHVATGLSIRIPKTPATLAAQAARISMQQASVAPPPPVAKLAPPPLVAPNAPPARPAAPHDSWIIIREAVSGGHYDVAIKEAETAHVTPDRAQAALLASAYAGNAKAIKASNAMLAETQAVHAGQLYLDVADRSEDAMDPLRFALAINPNDARAQTLLTNAKAKTADLYYRNGVAAFQKQDLDGAIAAWDRVLTIDPNHKNAQLNRAQAIELKQNLQKLR